MNGILCVFVRSPVNYLMAIPLFYAELFHKLEERSQIMFNNNMFGNLNISKLENVGKCVFRVWTSKFWMSNFLRGIEGPEGF